MTKAKLQILYAGLGRSGFVWELDLFADGINRDPTAHVVGYRTFKTKRLARSAVLRFAKASNFKIVESEV